MTPSPSRAPSNDSDRETIATEIAGLLDDWEQATQLTVKTWSALANKLPDACRGAGLSPTYGQALFATVLNAGAPIAAVRGAAADAHRQLETVGKRLGVAPTGSGPVQKDPDPGFVPTGASLTVVGEGRAA